MSLPDTKLPQFAVLPDSAPQATEAPLDPAVLARLANAFFAALPGQSPATDARPADALAQPRPPFPAGAQAPVNIAPPGSPLASAAGLGPNVPGTPVPQGIAPGANLLPASPAPLPSLANRAPGLVPHAQAGNGVPDRLFAELPAYEPRSGGMLTGAPQAVSPPAAATAQPGTQAEPAAFYFLDAGVPTPADAKSVLGHTRISDELVSQALGTRADTTDSRAAGRVGNTPSPAGPAGHSAIGSDSVVQAVAPYYFLDLSGAGKPGAGEAWQAGAPENRQVFDVHAVRRDFPILQERVNGRPLVWFDNAATTQKPQAVIDRLAHFYAHENSNIHRAAHALAARATDAYEGARETVRRFINAPEVSEVIFVRGTTEAINLVAKSWGWQHIGKDDEIIVSHLEHHANIVPWQQLAAAKGARIKVIPVDDDGQVLLDEYRKLLNDRTRIVSVTQVSNALGTVTPIKEIIELAHRAGALALVDGAQSVSHMRVDVQALDADFLVFSGHKIFGPTGIGVLWGKRRVLEDMPPWQGGGNMIADVTFEKTVFQPIPNTFEAGTGNIADAVGLGAALEYVERLGIERIAAYEHELLQYGLASLRDIPGLRLIGTAPDKASVMSFVLAGYSTEEVGRELNREGVAVRTGHHCAQPILRRFGVETTVRPSLAFYNTRDEIDLLASTVRSLAARRRNG